MTSELISDPYFPDEYFIEQSRWNSRRTEIGEIIKIISKKVLTFLQRCDSIWQYEMEK